MRFTVSCCFCSDQCLCKSASQRALSGLLGQLYSRFRDEIISIFISFFITQPLHGSTAQPLRNVFVFLCASWLSGWAGWCRAATSTHMISCQQEWKPFSETRSICRRTNTSDKSTAITTAQCAAYPTAQAMQHIWAVFSRMQIPAGFREAIHFRHHLVSWPISKAKVWVRERKSVCLSREWIMWLLQFWCVTLCNKQSAECIISTTEFFPLFKKQDDKNL